MWPECMSKDLERHAEKLVVGPSVYYLCHCDDAQWISLLSRVEDTFSQRSGIEQEKIPS